MPTTDTLHTFDAAHPPDIRRIGMADLRAALEAGYDDFMAMPTHVFFLVAIYPIAGLLIAALVSHQGLLPILFPLMAGFALIGPFLSIGLYELSRRREAGEDTSLAHAYESLRSESAGSLIVIGVALTVLFFAWLLTAMGLYWMLYGDHRPESAFALLNESLTTSRGWLLILLGNMIGFAFSLIALALSVVSIPMLVDREVDWQRAMKTSIAAVQANPGTMATWGLIVAALLALGMLPLFVGLALVLPVLGHATWHLYRRVVAL